MPIFFSTQLLYQWNIKIGPLQFITNLPSEKNSFMTMICNREKMLVMDITLETKELFLIMSKDVEHRI